MGCLNLNSLNRHIDEIKVFLVDNCLDILDIKETKLNGSFCDEQISLPGFNCLHRSRQIWRWCLYLHVCSG